jgi:uncharacterized protein YukE
MGTKQYKRIYMDINELDAVLDNLKQELSRTAANGENHIKASSKRARDILNTLKKETTNLKKQLLELDKNN